MTLEREYENLQLSDEDDLGSENENELFDSVKPPYMLEFEERAHIEHTRAPLKNFSEIKQSLKQQERRDLKRVPFFKSEYLTY